MDDKQIAALLASIEWQRIGAAIFILILAWAVAASISSFIGRLGDRLTGRRLLLSQVAALSRFLVYFVGVVAAAMTAIELRGDAATAATGAIGLAVGFAFKDLVATVIAGVTILIDKPFQVGDRITISGVYGEVKHIGLRSVRLATLDDNLVTIPNSKFMSEVVSSGNAGQLHMLVQMDFFIGVDQDFKRARELVGEALTSSRYLALDQPWVVQLAQVFHGDYIALRVRAKGYVFDVRYESAFQTDVTLRVMEAFHAHCISPPPRA